jgi:hypothetical protein
MIRRESIERCVQWGDDLSAGAGEPHAFFLAENKILSIVERTLTTVDAFTQDVKSGISGAFQAHRKGRSGAS